MRLIALTTVLLLCITSIPTSIAGGGDGIHYNGLNLNREPIDSHVLIDQNGNPYSTTHTIADATIVAFIFTRCDDVCPTITQNLKAVQNQVEDLDVQFMSITVDPDYDTPERLKEYMDKHDVTWPHLTGEYNDVSDVWTEFYVQVCQEYIDSRNNICFDEMQRSKLGMDMNHSDSVIITMPDGNSTEYDVNVNTWHQLYFTAFHNNWTLNYTNSEYGHMITGINGENSPEDWSWWWELKVWNDENSTWDSSMDGLDMLNSQPIAFAPNNSEIIIPAPMANHSSVTIVNVSGNIETEMMPQNNAWFNTFVVDMHEQIDNQNESWYWELHTWNNTEGHWEDTDNDMTNISSMHIAWAPNSTMNHMIPTPENMQSDDDHSHNHDHSEYNTLHTTLTFILDRDFAPKISFSGYDWDIDLFVEDVERTASNADGHNHSIPGFTFAIISASIGLAIIATSREDL